TLAPEVWRLVGAVADRFAGTRADVLRLAVPPRHARVEGESWPDPVPAPAPGLSGVAWAELQGGSALLSRLSAGESPRAVWTALPGVASAGGGRGGGSAPDRPAVGTDWAAAISQAVIATTTSGRGAVVVVPTASHVAQVTAALEAHGMPPWSPASDGGFVTLQAEDGPAPRYRACLAALR